jgi:phage-related protein
MVWFSALPTKFSTFGANIIAGLVNGITNGLGAVKTAITSAADSTVGWFKEKLGIHSPSRVFGELGGFISEGAAIGIDGGKAKVAKAALALATAATTSFAPAAAQVPIDARKTVLSAPGGGAAGGATATAAGGAPASYTINIHPAPGMDANAIARAVAAELDRRERSKQARHGSRLSD